MNLIPKYQNGADINTLADQIRANPFGSRDAFAESVNNSLQNSLLRVKVKRYADTITSNRNSEIIDRDNLNRAIEQGAELGLSPDLVMADYQTQSPAIESIHPEMLFTGAGLKAAGAAGKGVMNGAKAIGNWFESKLPGIGKAVTAATGVEGMGHYLSSEGGTKTFNKLYQGDWGGAAKSGFGDILDLAGIGIASKILNTAKNSGLPFWKSASSAEVPAAKLTSHVQGDDAVKMFKEYGGEPLTEGTINAELLKAYVPEARERYGLVGNTKVSDEEIAQALNKHIKTMRGLAKNNDGEPQLLFRGTTRRNTELHDKGLVPQSTSGADNVLGNLFLGELPFTRKGEGLERYLGTYRTGQGVFPPETGAAKYTPAWDPSIKSSAPIIDGVWLESGDLSSKLGSRKFGFNTRDVFKIKPEDMEFGANDINAFVVKSPKIRNATDEIVVLQPFDRIPENKRLGKSILEHYQNLVKDTLLKGEGLIKSDPKFDSAGEPIFRDEHEHFTYFALPNWNKQNAKHILPYDLRVPRDWKDPNIFRSEPIPASALSPATSKLNWSFGKIGDRFYLKNGNWDTAAAVEDIKLGKRDWKDWVTSDVYKKAAQDNKLEALARGEHYTPIHERPEFNDALDTGVKLTFDAKGPNGEYAYGSPIVNVNLAGSERANSTAYHELTHAAGIGTPSRDAMSKAGAGNMELAQKELAYLRFKAGQVFKPGSEYGGKFELDRHAMEAAANAREFGYLLGLKAGEPYPGYEKAMEIINSYPNLGNKAGLKELFLLDKEHMPYVWKALTGLQFGMIPIGLNYTFNTAPTTTNN